MAISFNIGGPTARARRAVPGLLLAPFALLAAVGAAPAGQSAQASEPMFKGPRLSIPENEQDFGLVTRGEVIEATFELRNVGSEPLKILRVKPG